MRIIKFRAWDDKDKKWLLGYNYPNLGGFSMFGECMLFEEWSSILNRFHLQRKDRTPLDLKLMQFTGLTDKNGKEIYEGDILKSLGTDICVVRYVKDLACFMLENINPTEDFDSILYPLHKGYEYREIIGNIYGNPELLAFPTADL